MNKIKKAVLPVAGLGTRFLPASKAIPKEMLPIIDKPLVQYAVEEAIEIGIEEIIFITSPSKYSIKKHFDFNQAIDNKLRNSKRSKCWVQAPQVILSGSMGGILISSSFSSSSVPDWALEIGASTTISVWGAK